jgi:hypothetical protein
LIIIEYFFRQKTSMLSFLKAVREMSWVLSDDERPKGKSCMKECHCLRDCVPFKEWLEKKRIEGYWSRRGDRAIRVYLRDVIRNMHA